MPTGGDTVTVLAGHTVSITQNFVYNGAPLHIYVYGIWYFSGGGSKITLPCGSIVEIMVGGLLQPNSNSGGHSETVRICGTTYWYFDQGPQSGYQIWPGPILPIELLSFNATAIGQSVRLRWSTASENGSDHFEVFISADGNEEDLLMTCHAQGNSASSVNYGHLDEGRAPGIWYYRLVEVDSDGSIHDHGTLAVLVKDMAKGITCMPNPVKEGHLLITSTEEMSGLPVEIHGMDMRLHRYAELVMDDKNMLLLNIGNLQRGVYVATVTLVASRRNTCTFVVD